MSAGDSELMPHDSMEHSLLSSQKFVFEHLKPLESHGRCWYCPPRQFFLGGFTC